MQTRQSLRSSHKMAFNRYLSHHVRILNCGEGSKAQTRPSNCADSPKPSLFAGMTPKNSEYDRKISHSQTAEKPMAPRGIATQQSRGTRRYRFFTFYASTSAENCHHQLVLATTGAFTLTSVY